MLVKHISKFILAGLMFILLIQCAFAQQPGQSEIRPLVPGQKVERELKGDDAHSYSLALQAGQFLNVVVEQKGIDVIVTLFDSNNKKLGEVDSPNGTQGPEPLSAVIETTGNYRLEVRSLEKSAPAGRYEAKLLELRTATAKDKNVSAAQKAFAEGEALRSQGTADSLRGAMKKYEEALPLYRAVGDKSGEATMLTGIGFVYFNLGDKHQALNFYSESLPLYRVLGDKRMEATMLNNIGEVYSNVGDKQQSLKYLNESLPLRRAAGDKRGEAITLNNIGIVNRDLGQNEQALKFYNEALLLYRAGGLKREEATTLSNIGSIYSDLGDRQQALKFYNEALLLDRAGGDKRGEAVTLNAIGKAYYEMGEKKQALKFFNESLPLRRVVGDKRGEAQTLNNIGVIHRHSGEPQQALKVYNEALLIFRAVGDKPSEANMLSNISGIYFDLGEKQKAVEYHVQAMPLLRLVGDRRVEAITLGSLFTILSSDNPRYGVFYGKQAINDLQILRSNVRGLSKNIQQTFLKSIEYNYRRLADALLKQGRFAEAQQTLNLFKDQQYFDFNSNKEIAPLALTMREAVLSAGFDQKLEKIGNLTRQRDETKRNVGRRKPTDAEAAQLKQIESDLQKATDDYHAFLKTAEAEFAAPPDDKDKSPDVADVRETQTALEELSASTKQKTVAVYTLVGDENFRALVVTPDDMFSVSTPIKVADFNKKALLLWSLLRTSKYDPQPAANELYKIVFEPIAAQLPKDTKTILWSLDGTLRYIPMAALHDGKKYLVERFENVIFTRADRDRMTRAVNTNLVGTGFGSSEAHTVELLGGKYNASALPAVKVELGRIFKKENPRGVLAGTVLLDEQFTKTAMLSELKARRPLVHIASHFRFEPGDEARSFLLLGDGSPFTLDEMKQNADLFSGIDLLTLSACQTAAQRADANGREVDGFAELAQRLGAGAVMASLWEVSDNSTAELMTRFYRSYRGSSGENKAEALRRAQLALLRGTYNASPTAATRQSQQDNAEVIQLDQSKLQLYRAARKAPFAHPFYWSPFILVGNWK